ncbi:MAG: acetyltransferase [Candidatus Pristimantibacillus lignocellulolyticus]|uniref:Acetyltransferase n=1 Tax=Candidatus Pristimantibacillus lignocellulolyticus TaxID=2994561 RepID=A0A9J6ZDU9_9BACL|nr:MAG: acetyltransferase [Candidatus Pristimantibacillus lignocellulolyticus]
MNKKIIIIGNTEYSRLIRYYIEVDTELEVIAYSVEKDYVETEYFDNIPLIALEELTKSYPVNEYDIILGVGYSKMNTIREKLYRKIKKYGYRVINYIHSTAVISSNSVIGEGNIIMENVVVAPYSTIGSGNIIWNSVNVSHNNVVGNFNSLSVGTSLSGFVEVGNNCFLGNNCTVKNHLKIANYSLIGASSYVSESTEEYQVIVPQKSIVLDRKISTDLI